MRITSLVVAAALTVLSAAAFAQTETPKPPPPIPYSTGPLPQIDNGSPGLDVAGPDVSTKSVKPVPCSKAAHETDGTTTCVGIEDTKRRR
jgi:hypothetical protein